MPSRLYLRRKTLSLLSAGLVSVAAFTADAKPAVHHHATFEMAPALAGRTRGKHSVALVGDRDSGLGFYPLPRQYRVAGERNHRSNAIRYAIASEPGYGYYYGIGGEDGASLSHHHALFNPVDGYGTPFFAGYYGSAHDDDDAKGPFGTPYAD